MRKKKAGILLLMTVFFCLLTFASCGARVEAPGGM